MDFFSSRLPAFPALLRAVAIAKAQATESAAAEKASKYFKLTSLKIA